MRYQNQSLANSIFRSPIFWAAGLVALIGVVIVAFAIGIIEFSGNVYVGRTIVQTVEVEKPIVEVVNEPVTVEVDRFIGVPQTVEVERVVEVPVTVEIEVDRIVEVPVTVEVESRVEVPATVIVEQPVPVTVVVERAVAVPIEARQNSGPEDSENPVATPDDTGRIVPPPALPIVETSGFHTCELRLNGTMVCWGGTADLLNESNERFVAASVGNQHSCALRPDGSPLCWGIDDGLGAISPPVNDIFAAISVGSDHSCALRADGTPICWGSQNNNRQSTPPEGVRFVNIEAGNYSTCGLMTNGAISCWGQYGTQPKTLREGHYIGIASGSSDQVKCALRNDGDAVCWQDGAAQKPFVGPYTQITVGTDFLCGLLEDGRPQCHLMDFNNQNPRTDNAWGIIANTPVQTNLVSIHAGAFHVCAIGEDGVPICWGDNSQGQLDIPP